MNEEPYPGIIEPSCHNCIHERDPYFVFGSTIRTLTVGSLIFIVAFSWSEFAKISFHRYGCFDELDPLHDRSEEFNLALRYALIVTFAAIIVSFLVMFYIPGTKW